MAGRNSIYEVFRACRLCGGGGGYKMPIVNLEDELDMRHKIRECVRIEVHQDDKMPPLICELCVDKVNDYFEFLEMCRATDSRTRQRLGLQQSVTLLGANDPGDCILGVTEPLFVNDDNADSSDAEPLARQKNRIIIGGKSKKTPPAAAGKKSSSSLPVLSIRRSGIKDSKTGIKELRVSINGSDAISSRSSSSTRNSRSGRRAPSPPPPPAPMSRRSQRDDSKDSGKKVKVEVKKEVKKPPAPSKPPPRGVHRSQPLSSQGSLLTAKRSLGKREKERDRDESRSAKRVKIAPKLPPTRSEKRRASPAPKPEPKKPAREPPALPCKLCDTTCSKPHQLQQHMKAAHSPTFTLDRLACNACGEWFMSGEEAATHHRWHKSAAPYVCRLCTAEFRQLPSYNKHFANKQCVPSTEVPDKQCSVCWAYFATAPLLDKHKCRGEDARPGGNCAKCKRKYATYRTLRKHEDACCKPGPKRRGGGVNVSPELMKRVLPMQIRVARCDPLLASVKQEMHYDVSHVNREFGLDKTCVYPYIASVRSIKHEPGEYGYVKQEMDFEESGIEYEYYTDSDSEPEMIETEEQGEPRMVVNPFAKKKKSIDALSTLSIKAIFSKKLLGPKKIQRKKKKRPIIKPEVKEEIQEPEVDPEIAKVIDNEEENRTEKDKSEETLNDLEQTNIFDDDDDVRRTVDDLIAGLGTTTDDVDMFDDPSNVDLNKKVSPDPSTEQKETLQNTVEKLIDGDKVVVADDTEAMETDHTSFEDKGKELSQDKPQEQLTTSDEQLSNELTENSINKDSERMQAEVSDCNLSEDVTSNKENGDVTETCKDEEASVQKDEIPEQKHDEDKETSAETELTNDDEDFDMNTVFSGDLGATALKAQGKLKADKTDVTDNSNKDIKMTSETPCTTQSNNSEDKDTYREILNVETEEDTIVESDLVAVSDNQESNTNPVESIIEEVMSSKETAVINNSVSVIVSSHSIATDKTGSIDKMETTDTIEFQHRADSAEKESTNQAEDSEQTHKDTITDPPHEIPKYEQTTLSELAQTEEESKSSPTKTNADDMLNELDDISDTEFDDNELMNEIDAQISGTTEEKDRTEKKATEGEKRTELNKADPDDKISLDDLLMASAEVNPANTDDKLVENIDAEFNFDG